jgi:hypothetical protein
LQKLYYLNSDAMAKRSAALAKRIAKRDQQAGVAQAYRLLFNRAPSEKEQHAAREFLRQSGKDRWGLYAQVLLSSNEFAYVD